MYPAQCSSCRAWEAGNEGLLVGAARSIVNDLTIILDNEDGIRSIIALRECSLYHWQRPVKLSYNQELGKARE